MEVLIHGAYIAASILFILGLRMLSHPSTARPGNVLSASGMLLAIMATLLSPGIDYRWTSVGLIVGSLIGAVVAQRVQMTAMPQMVALFNGLGGLASLLVGWAEYHAHPDAPVFTSLAISLTVLVGGVTFSGSMIAYGKLAARISVAPLLFTGQKLVNGILVLTLLVLSFILVAQPTGRYPILLSIIVLALVLGILGIIPIGGADMPVVISLLNSYSGIAAAAAGFVIVNNVLIVAGCLVGASGLILTNIMCKAMNRSLPNVLFSGFGSAATLKAGQVEGVMREANLEDVAIQMAFARQVVIVPGYGMATAQAQHTLRELAEALERRGVTVKFAIHPVAGRMPGHMNVLLAEANVPYSQLYELEQINPEFPSTDVAVVVGANDVVNSDARDNPASLIAGMPILEVDRAKSVVVLKRGHGRGFSGVENPLFGMSNCAMLYGDAKETLTHLVQAVRKA